MIKTLDKKITHKINPIHDEERFAALDAAYEELIAEIDEDLMPTYICNNLELLQMIAPVISLMVVDDLIVIIEAADTKSVKWTKEMTRQEITQALIMAVKKGV